MPVEQLQHPKVRETVLVSFTRRDATATARFLLDANTGDFVSAEFSDPEFAPTPAGKGLSTRAQRVLKLASDESKQMGCDHVGSDHLLLGLLVHGEGIGPAVLSAVGLTAEAVRLRIASIGATAEVASGGYAPSIRHVLRLACQHADALRHPEIEPEHFVLALLDKFDGPAMSLFRHFAVDIERVKSSLLRRISAESL